MRMPRFRNSPAWRSSSKTPNWNNDSEPARPGIGGRLCCRVSLSSLCCYNGPLFFQQTYSKECAFRQSTGPRQNRFTPKLRACQQLAREMRSIYAQAANYGVRFGNRQILQAETEITMLCRAIPAVILFVIFNVHPLRAQTYRGAIQGTVIDASGSVVARAQITVISEDTNLAREAASDDSGDYLVTELPPGSYRVTAAVSGFQKQVVTGVYVEVATSSRVDLTLSPGQVTEIIEAAGVLPLLETFGNNQGSTMGARQASELPLKNGRDFVKTMLLIPGATADPSSVSDAPGSFGTFSMNGSRGKSNNYLLDGIDMNDSYHNSPAINEPGVWGTPATLLPLDALAEIPVLSGVDAQSGRNSGAIVNLVTKSGTNQLHGSAFEYFRNSALDARNYFNIAALPQNPFHNNQFGGSLGGPIIKNKTFFFLAYEGQREYGGLTSLGHVPTEDDIAAALASPTVVNAGGGSPIIANLLARHPWPAANVPADSNGNNLLAITRFSNRIDSMMAKVDHQFASGDILTSRYYFGDSDQSYPLGLVGGGILPGFNTITPTRVQLVSLSYTHVFTPRLLLELRGGYNRF